MPELNRVSIAGRLTSDPSIKYTPDGLGIANFKLAVNHYIKNKDESEVSYFDVVAFGKVVEFIREYIKKGNLIVIDGKLHQTRYSIKIDGEEKMRSKTEIIVNSIFPVQLNKEKTIEDEGTIEF